ncbi:MAG: thiamine diphosphokinase [Anaerolineae bacterium]|nr:thiamine diphosphokinase [Anaerolineae bacterium]
MENVIIFANGHLNDGIAVRQALERPALLMAADGGANLALKMDYLVSVVIGDMDSIFPETLTHLEAQGAEVLRFPMEKNETDLELALREAVRRGARWIRLIGAVGNRLDQTMANVYLMNLPELAAVDVRIVAGRQTIWLLPPGDHVLLGEVGDTLSLIPISGDVTGITTSGLKYVLREDRLAFGPARGVSNVIIQAEPQVHIAAGILMVVHTVGRA